MDQTYDMNEITEARRKAIAASIRTIQVDELKQMGEGLFPFSEHPWRHKFFEFLQENAAHSFYHGTTHDRVQVLYCKERDQGMWFIPGTGMGPLQPKGLATLKGIVEGKRS